MRVIAMVLVTVLAGCASVEDKQDRRQAEIKMVEQQMQARAQMEVDKARAQAALYNAMAAVAASNPQTADAIAVGMALAVSRSEGDSEWGPIVTLSQEKDPAQEWAKILAGPVLNSVTALGTAGIAASVSRNASDNMARVSINEAEQQTRQFEALAGLGSAAANLGSQAVQNAGGNTTYNVSDDGFINNGENIHDSYNTTNTEETNTTTTTTTTSTITDTVTYGGQQMTLDSLLAFLAGTGKAYELTIGSTTYTVDGDGEPITIDCSEPQFSPAPPECST